MKYMYVKRGEERCVGIIGLFKGQGRPPIEIARSASASLAQARTASHAPLLPSWRLSARQLDQLDRGEAGLGRRRDAWPLLRPSRTLKRRQPAARPRILHTRRHDQAERARCRVMVRAACEGRLWPQQVHQTDLKACRRRAVVARAETAAEEPSAVAIQRLPGSPGGSPCPF